MRPRLLLSLCALAGAAAAPLASAAEDAAPGEGDAATHAIFLLVRATPHWLALAPEERFAFIDAEVQPRLAAHPQVRVRFWDVEHLNARVSDVILFETPDLRPYRSLVEGLRETRFWDHYFEVKEILPGVENAYAEHYEVTPYGADRPE